MLPVSERNLKVLLVEDDDEDIFLIKELLREGFFDCSPSIDVAKTIQKGVDHLTNNNYHICLFDYNLGKNTGIELLKQLHERDIRLPIIMMTGRGDQEIAVAALKAGATDYIEKSKLSVKSLEQSIRYALKLHEEEVQRRKAEETLVRQEKLLQRVADASSRLLIVQDFNQAVEESLPLLAEAADFTQIYIFEHHTHPDTKLKALSEKFSWKTVRGGRTEPFLNVLYSDLANPECYAELAKGAAVQVDLKNLPKNFAGVLRDSGVPNALLLPIFIEDQYWGILVLCYSKELFWNKNEIGILRIAAANFGGKIKGERDARLFESIVEGTSSHMGEEFFNSLVHHLSNALGVSHVFIVEYLEFSPGQCCVLAGWQGGGHTLPRQYSASNSPCEEAMAGLLTFYPQNLGQFFETQPLAGDKAMESYAAVPFFSGSNKALGHLAIMDSSPIQDRQRTLSILKIFAARAGAELERKRAEEAVKSMAYFDNLTGLPNRVLLNDRLIVALAQAGRAKNKLAVMYMDFDRFKLINDTYGHGVGDIFLQKAGARLKSCLRGTDTLARLGGDEFILVQTQIRSTDDVVVLCNKILENMRPPIVIENIELLSTISIGIAIYPEDGSNSKTLLKNADAALYAAKAAGRDNFKLFSEIPAEQQAPA